MSEAESTRVDDGMSGLKERKRLIDDVWLLACFALLVAIGLPWYLRLLDVDFTHVAWSIFGYGLIYVGTSLAAERLESRRALLFVIGALQVIGVLFIGLIWHLTGSLQNPMFALAFVVPIVTASLVLVTSHTIVTAALGIVTVLAVAIVDVPELRWYVTQAGPWTRPLVALLPGPSLSTAPLFPGLSLPPSYVLVLLLLFGVLTVAVTLMTGAYTSHLVRLYRRVESSANALARAETLSSDVLEASPVPAALVYADTFTIEQASSSFFRHLVVGRDDLLTKNLFAVVDFTYPEVIEALITGGGGEAPLTTYRIGGELRAASVRVDPISHGGRRYAYLTMQDVSDREYLRVTLDSIDALLIVIGGGRVLHFNQAAKRVFPDLEPGMDAATPLGRGNLPAGWWELNNRSRQERQVEFAGRRYAATCVAAGILGARDALAVVTLQAAARPA